MAQTPPRAALIEVKARLAGRGRMRAGNSGPGETDMRQRQTAILRLAAAAAATWLLAGPAMAASVEAGERLAARNCVFCHAIGKTGASPNPAAPPFRLLHERYKIDDLQEAFAEGILTGHPAMPQFRFASGEVEDLLAYLKSIQTGGGPSASAGGGARMARR